MKKNLAGIIVDVFLVAVLAALYALTALPEARAAMATAYNAPAYRGQAEDALAIQFAVDWDASALGGILDALKEKDVRVTFAVSGEWADNNPGLVRRIAEEGHELASMGYHPDEDEGLKGTVSDISRSVEAIEALSGQRPLAYYSGSRNATISSRAAKKLSLAHVLCTIDLMCAKGVKDDIISRASTGAFAGSIILMQPTQTALEALPQIIDELDRKGLRAVRTRDIVDYGIL